MIIRSALIRLTSSVTSAVTNSADILVCATMRDGHSFGFADNENENENDLASWEEAAF